MKSALNILLSLASYFVIMVFSFVAQSVIVKRLGIEYSGLNGLFTNIITMLSLAELGLGTTIIYKLYKPVADHNNEDIKKWLYFFKKCYYFVAFAIVALGLLLMPFITNIVGDNSLNENIHLLYFLALVNTACSYVLSYKRSLFYADQKNYIINLVHIIYVILLNSVQITLIFATQNYVLYLAVKPIFQLLENAALSIYADKKYPYIKEKATSITELERKDFFSRIIAMFIQKVSFVVNKGIDSIVISMGIGVASVGYYANYNLIATTICGIIYQIISGFEASVGNLLTENKPDKSFKVYKKIDFLNFFLTGLGAVGFACCIQPFIALWLGSEYLLDLITVLSFVIYIYADSSRRSITIFKDAAGICKEDKIMYVYMTVLNLLLSIFLCNSIGISGVVLGTAISYLFLIICSYPRFIYNSVFERNGFEYLISKLKHVAIILVTIATSMSIAGSLQLQNKMAQVAINLLLSVVIYLCITMLAFYKTDEFKYYANLIGSRIKKNKERR